MRKHAMQQFSIVPLYGFRRAHDFLSDVEIIQGMQLIRNTEMFASLAPPGFEQAIGRLEYEGLQRCEAAVWFPISDEDVLANPRRFLFQRLMLVKLFLNMLWAVKDCSVNCKLGFLRWSNGDSTGWESNALGRLYSNAAGDVCDSEFSREDVEKAKLLTTAFGLFGPYKREQRTAIVKGNSRLAIFFHQIEAGRSAQDLALRIMHGCSALEGLLSTSITELSHQLSERTALLAGSSTGQRHQLFLDMKSTYDIRSKVTHGSPLSAKRLKDLPAISAKLDGLLRAVFWKIIQSKDLYQLFSRGSDDDINGHFVALLFPSGPEP